MKIQTTAFISKTKNQHFQETLIKKKALKPYNTNRIKRGGGGGVVP